MFGFSSIAIINDVAGLTTIQAEFVLNAIISFGLSEFSLRSRGSTDSIDFHGNNVSSDGRRCGCRRSFKRRGFIVFLAHFFLFLDFTLMNIGVNLDDNVLPPA